MSQEQNRQVPLNSSNNHSMLDVCRASPSQCMLLLAFLWILGPRADVIIHMQQLGPQLLMTRHPEMLLGRLIAHRAMTSIRLNLFAWVYNAICLLIGFVCGQNVLKQVPLPQCCSQTILIFGFLMRNLLRRITNYAFDISFVGNMILATASGHLTLE